MATPTNHLIDSEELMAMGYTPGRAFGVALRTANKHEHLGKEVLLAQLADVLADPGGYATDAVYGKLARTLVEEAAIPQDAPIPLRDTGDDYAIYGESHIEAGARAQMPQLIAPPSRLH